MLQGYPFKGTGAATPTSSNATIYDPILEATCTTLTIRGKIGFVSLIGVSFGSDIPALGSRMQIKVGNDEPSYRFIDVFPTFDLDLVSEQIYVKNFIDLGGIHVSEDELIDIRLYDPGAAEVMSGVLWVEDFEPSIPIPKGRVTSIKCGGTNDGGTSLATTGFDMDSRKLSIHRLYTPFMVCGRPEDKICEVAILRAEKDVMTLPQMGCMVYPTAPIQFTGQQYNSGQVLGKLQVQAATKVEFIIYMIESPLRSDPDPPGAAKILASPVTIPGLTQVAQLQAYTAPKPNTSFSRPMR